MSSASSMQCKCRLLLPSLAAIIFSTERKQTFKHHINNGSEPSVFGRRAHVSFRILDLWLDFKIGLIVFYAGLGSDWAGIFEEFEEE